MSPVNASQTARERARAELTREIKEEARRQLAAVGADGLSLRAVARALGMVSSALYRYFPSRDDLLTALIIDAYNAVGDAAEKASAAAGEDAAGEDAATAVAAGGARARWAAVCHAVRGWALANPHEYALIYGSPVPGYRAPTATIGPASRVPLAFVRVLRDAVASGELAGGAPDGKRPDGGHPAAGGKRPDGGHPAAGGGRPGPGPGDGGPPAGSPVDGMLAGQADALAAALQESDAPVVPPDALVRGVIGITQLFGMLSFELFGQFVGSFEPADALFDIAVAQMTTFVGLR